MNALTRTHFADSVDTDLGRWLLEQSRENARDDAIADEAERLEKRPAEVMNLLRVHAKPGSEIKSAYDALILMLATAEVDAREDAFDEGDLAW